VYASYSTSWDTDAPLDVFVPGPPALRTRARLQQLEDKVTFLEAQLQSTHKQTADKIRRAKEASAKAVQNVSHRLDAAERATTDLETKVLNRELFGLLLVAVGAVLQGVAGVMTIR
jgi:cell division protein FtsB